MYKRLYQFLDAFEVLYPLQFGFREKHSTTHALLCLTESIKHSVIMGSMDVEYSWIYKKLLTQ